MDEKVIPLSFNFLFAAVAHDIRIPVCRNFRNDVVFYIVILDFCHNLGKRN